MTNTLRMEPTAYCSAHPAADHSACPSSIECFHAVASSVPAQYALLDTPPIKMRDPFAPYALVPMSVETKNSRYEFTEFALTVGHPARVSVECVRGTFAGTSWIVDRADIHLTRYTLIVEGGVGLRTTAPTKVNEQDVSYWAPEAKLSREREEALERSRAYVAALRAERMADRPKVTVYGQCNACGALETALNNPTGTKDLSYMGESDKYPTGYGCELCD